MLRAALLTGAIIALAGCDIASSVGDRALKALQPSPPTKTVVFMPGVEINVNGKATAIRGFDECPLTDEGFLKGVLGPELPNSDPLACLNVPYTATSVEVRVYLDVNPTLETWKVERREGRIMLSRPDGSPVTFYRGQEHSRARA